MDDYVWENCFENNQLKSAKVKTIRQSYSIKKPLKPIVKAEFKQKFWEINPQGQVTLHLVSIPLNDSIIDTAVSWFFYEKNRLSIHKKTGIGGIAVKSIQYRNEKPYCYTYGKSQNQSSKKTILDLTSYVEERKEYIQTTEVGKYGTIEKHLSSDSVVFKTIYTEIREDITKLTSVKFPLNAKNDYFVSQKKDENHSTSICINSKNSDSICFVTKTNEQQKVLNYETYNLTQQKKTHFTEFIYNEKSQLLQAMIKKDLESQNIEIIKYRYTFYD